MSVPRRLIGWAGRPLLACVAVGFVIGVFELGLRITGHEALYEIYSKPSQFWQHDELLGWAHEPGASGRYVGPRPWPVEFDASVSINSLGLRGPELRQPEPGELRLLALGDSMVAGFEVDYEDTFVARLGRALSNRMERPVHPINAGVRGYGTDQSYLYFRERGRRLGADAVLFFASGNDPADNTTLHETRRPFGKPALALGPGGALDPVGVPPPRYGPCEAVNLSAAFEVVREDSVSSRVLCRAQMALFDHSALFSFMTIALPWDQDLLRSLYHLGNPQDPADSRRSTRSDFRIDLTVAILEALASEVRASGATLVVTGWPHHLELLVEAELGPEVEIVPLETLWNAPDAEVRWNHDSHLNPEGHRRLAERVVPVLEQQLRRRSSEQDSSR